MDMSCFYGSCIIFQSLFDPVYSLFSVVIGYDCSHVVGAAVSYFDGFSVENFIQLLVL